MDRNKIIIIVILALIVVAYLVFVVWGSTKHDKKDKTQRKSTAETYEPDPGMSKFGNVMGAWLGRFLPKTNIPCSTAPSKNSDLICDALSVGSNIKIQGKKGSSFRIATLVLKEGRAHVEYDDNTGAASDADMDEQVFELPDTDNNVPNQNTIVIFENGGELKITCKDNAGCRVGYK